MSNKPLHTNSVHPSHHSAPVQQDEHLPCRCPDYEHTLHMGEASCPAFNGGPAAQCLSCQGCKACRLQEDYGTPRPTGEQVEARDRATAAQGRTQ